MPAGTSVAPDDPDHARRDDRRMEPLAGRRIGYARTRLRRLLGRYRGLDYHLVDHLALGYMAAVGGVVLVFRHSAASWPIFVVVHLAYLLGALELIRAASRRPARRALVVARTFHPAVFFLVGYVELDYLHLTIFADPWATDWLVQADRDLFGTNPTVWVERLYGTWLDEVLSATYLSYYFLGLLVTVPLMIEGRREHVLAVGAVAGLTYVVNYGLFFLLPAEGPRFVPGLAELHEASFGGYLFGPLCQRIMGDAGAIKAGCFPSSHVSGAVAFALAAHRYGHPLIARAVTVCAIGIFFATVYLGYHYGVDPLGGVLVGYGSYRVAVWALARRGEEVARRRGLRDVEAPRSP
jgi:membrane-associated phospholipid phosphatase